MLQTDFDNFREEISQIINLKDHNYSQVRSEIAEIATEQVKLLERFEEIDWKKVQKAETLANQYTEGLQMFEDSIQRSFKRWRQTNSNLQNKYDRSHEQVNTLNEITKKLSDDFESEKQKKAKEMEIVCEYINLQVAKDVQDGEDR